MTVIKMPKELAEYGSREDIPMVTVMTPDGPVAELAPEALEKIPATIPTEIEQKTKPLSEREKKLRADLERQIVDTMGKTYVTVGRALKIIKQERLYRTTHYTFENYCQHIFEMSRSLCYKYLEAYEVVEQIQAATMLEAPIQCGNFPHSPSGGGNNTEASTANQAGKAALLKKTLADPAADILSPPIPARMDHARALARIKNEQDRLRLWFQVVKASLESGQRITKRIINDAVNDLQLETIEKAAAEKVERVKRATKKDMSEPMKAAFNALMALVRAEEASHWRTSKQGYVGEMLMSMGADILRMEWKPAKAEVEE